MTDSSRWNEIQRVFHRVVDMPPDVREHVLVSEYGNDKALQSQVRALLDADARENTALDGGLADTAHAILGGRSERREIPSIGPYIPLRMLGEGGMGVVHLARREDVGNLVALKLLRDASLSPARRERFASEQRTLAQLAHPNIAQLYDAGTTADGTPWFAMEYVDGVSLSEYCETRNATLQTRLRLFRDVCTAVQFAHERAIIHRDLKPSNILVTGEGQVKLLDFGIAKQLENLDSDADPTRTALRLMTPAYASPEQLSGRSVGVQADVYSLGVILFELLTHRLPFDVAQRTPAELERLVAEYQPPRPSGVAIARKARLGAESGVPHVSRRQWTELDVICLTALHKDISRRYRTVDALVRDLDHFQEHEPLEARPDSAGYRLRKFVQRNRTAVIGSAAVVALLVSLVGFYTGRLASARDAAIAEASRAQRIQQFMVSLFQGGDPDVSPADSLRVITLIERGVQEASGLAAEPAVQAELYQTLGELSRQLGLLDQADTLLTSSLEKRRRIAGARQPDLSRSMVALSLLRSDQARYDDAEQLARSALALVRESEAGGHSDEIHALSALGHVLELRGRYSEAIAAYDTATRIAPQSDPPAPEYVSSMYGLANNHFYIGDYEAADSLSRQVLRLSRQLYGERHPRVASDLINLGAVQFELGNYPEANRLYREALEINMSWHGADHPSTAANLTMLGRALVYEGKRSEAAAVLEQAHSIQERVYGPMHPRVASALNELGNLAVTDGRLADAERHFLRMLDIQRQMHGNRHNLYAVAVSNLATVHMQRGSNAEAERLFREAVDVFETVLPAGHSSTGIARIKLGRVLLRQGRYREAIEESAEGYEIVAQESEPGVSFLVAARSDLAAAWDSLGVPEEAEKYREEARRVGG
ncbi:MAG TPA: serine/threonine-protein kinase [Gemmatimonadales bacterium]|nr:serine/threonine-protein kinase [Gemmatimonadales bacterium]